MIRNVQPPLLANQREAGTLEGMGRMNRRFLGYFLMFATGAVFGQAGWGRKKAGMKYGFVRAAGTLFPGGTQNTEAFNSGLPMGGD
jgi:hypothetical protein